MNEAFFELFFKKENFGKEKQKEETFRKEN